MAVLSGTRLAIYGALMTLLLALVACGTSTPPTPVPPVEAPAAQAPAAPAVSAAGADSAPAAPAATQAPAAPAAPAAAAAPPTAIPKPSAPMAEAPKTAKDKAVAVIGTEPVILVGVGIGVDAHIGQLVDTLAAYIGHLDKDTLQISPTSMIQSWKQAAPDEWEYNLRPGVTFHDGEEWNTEAWALYAKYAGVPDFGVTAFSHTGPYTVESIDALTARVKCGEPCPNFDRGLSLSYTYSPGPLRTVEQGQAQFIELNEEAGAGPYYVDNYEPGIRLVSKRFEGFVPAPETPEYAAPILEEIEWQWRAETTVRTAMIETDEADWAFLITLEEAERLGSDRFVTGGTAEIAQFTIDTIWHPWLKQLKMRQAIVHAIDCQAIVDALYRGATTCRGNHGAPGVLGITEANIAPYEFDPPKARLLLEEIGYICGLPNSADNCEGEVEITSKPDRIAKNIEMVESMTSFMAEVGINAKAQFVEPAVSRLISNCGIGSPGGTQIDWEGATEATPPSCEGGVAVRHIHTGIGFGYELMDYAKLINRHMLCESNRSTVCVPELDAEWKRARTLSGDERRIALEKIADWQREQVYILPMFDLFAIYGVNPKLRGFEEPRFDKHLFANLWWFDE